MFIYPATAVPDGGSGNPDISLLCLIDIRTMVMGGVAAQHVQPLSSKPFLTLNEVFGEPPGSALCRKAGGGAVSLTLTFGPVAQLVRAHP